MGVRGISKVLFGFALLSLSETSSSITPRYSPIVVAASYSENYEKVINSTVEYVFLYPVTNRTLMEAAKIQVVSNASESLPLLVVVKQVKGILSWEIPLLIDSKYFETLAYNKTSRTLCSMKYYQFNSAEEAEVVGNGHDDGGDGDDKGEASKEGEEEEAFVTVTISSASSRNTFFGLNVTKRHDFELRVGSSRTVTISPSEPIYYGYSFEGGKKSTSVLVHVLSDNDVCMTFSIQNTTCPVFDLERNIEFSGYWQTVSRQGGIMVPRDAYPLGFFVVLVVKGDDTDCVGTPSSSSPRSKSVTLTIQEGFEKHDMVLASALMLSVIMGFCIVVVGVILLSKVKQHRRLLEHLDAADTFDPVNDPRQATTSIEEVGPSQCPSLSDDSSLDENDVDMLEDALSDKDVIRTKLVLSVCDLARKNPRILRHKSRLYLYYLGTVAIFYTLPAIQLVIRYQDVLHVTGNQDLCYYNFLCAHPLGFVSDFNHVFSNISYILLGLLFIFITYIREHGEVDHERSKSFGIPQHYGLFYAMGTALIMEGVLSGTYHVCPNRSNFQFDTSFMYIIAILCMIKIYQTRHPDINARAPVTFGLLAFIIFIGLMGVFSGSTYFWVTFTILHLLVCLLLTIQIYYMGRWKLDRGSLRRMIQVCKHDAQSGVKNLLKPLYAGRFAMLVVANLCNVGLAVYGNITHERNFATFLLEILMSNLILYTLFYIVMKLCHRERILLHPALYIILSIIFWAAALYFFNNRTMSWALTPAQSRLYNQPCALLNFFDSHDIWHMLSAFAMFFSFMVLLTLDDDLADVHRSQIPVF